LTEAEEQLLATALKFLGDSNQGQDREDVQNMVEEFIRATNRPNPFKELKPGIDWIHGFEKRHPEISQRSAETLTIARAKSLTSMRRFWMTTQKMVSLCIRRGSSIVMRPA
jgi:hypothetical protein